MTSSRSSRKASSVRRPALAREAGVVGRGPVAGLRERARDGLGDAPRGGVHDDHPVVVGEQADAAPRSRSRSLAHRHHAEPEIGAVERAEVLVVPAGPKAKRAGDVPPDLGRGAAGERDGRRPAQPVARGAERPVAGPEVVPPLGDAVGLVDGQQGRPEARCACSSGASRSSRSGETYSSRSVPASSDAPDPRPLGSRSSALWSAGGRDAAGHGRRDLVLHQRDERGDDDA